MEEGSDFSIQGLVRDFLGEIAIEQLENSELGQEVGRALHIIATIQENLGGLAQQCDQQDLLLVKVGTILCLAILKKAGNGSLPQNFTEQDWKDVAGAVSEYAIVMDGQAYTAFVFSLYADYIDYSASTLEGVGSASSTDAIHALARSLRDRTGELRDGELTEPDYVESCLWISLEAMIKLLSSLFVCGLSSSEFEQLATAITQLAFEYGRYRLYVREQRILEEYVEHQYELDAQLQKEYEAYQEALEAEAERFLTLLDNAFDSDINEQLKASILLAQAAGVDGKQILDTAEKVDNFFLD